MSENLNGGTTAVFAVTLSVAIAAPVSVFWETKDGTGKAGVDYQANSGTVEFLPGETEKQIQVLVYGRGENIGANDRTFYITLNPPANAILNNSLVECTISVTDDEGTPVTELIVAQGKRGLKGEPGLSAYEQAVMMGFTGTIEDWMNEIADASQAADEAQAAAVRAEAAATAASFLGNIFPSPEAGVDPETGVPSGAYFNVRSSNDDDYIEEYRNISGVPTPTGKSYPSANAVKYQLDGTIAPNTSAAWGAVPQIKKLTGDVSPELNAQPKVLLKMLNDIRKNGGAMPFSQTFADVIGGFDIGDEVKLSDGTKAVSTITNNTNDPNVSRIGWDEPYNVYDFKTEQPLQWYFNKYGNWDDAIFEAQCNIFTRGFSTILRLPVGNIMTKRPIFGGVGLIEYINIHRPDINTNVQWPPLTLIGAPRSTEGRPEEFLGTQLVFDAVTGPDDKTWSNFGAIHAAPLNYLDMRDAPQHNAPSVTIRDINIRPSNINIGQSMCHGIVVRSGSKHYFQNITLYGFYGAGMYLDWVFDSQFDQITFIRCGRMSPNKNDFINDGKYGVEYQTYAPLHIQHTSPLPDNSNFLHFHKTHFEDNGYGAADIIVSGNSSPVTMYDNHHETDGIGSGSVSEKCVIALGGYGVKYFGQDTEASFDYKAFDKSTEAAFVTLNSAVLYNVSYGYASKQTAFCGLGLLNSTLNREVYVQSYNSAGGVTIENSTIADFVHEGFTDRGYLLRAVGSDMGDIYLGKGNGSGGSVSLTSCNCGDMSIGSNSAGPWANGVKIEVCNASFNKISGSYPNFYGSLRLTSENEASDFSVRIEADIDIQSYKYFDLQGGV